MQYQSILNTSINHPIQKNNANKRKNESSAESLNLLQSEQDFKRAARDSYSQSIENMSTTSNNVNSKTSKMTLTDYKLYIYDIIDQMPRNNTQSNWDYIIEITDEGFEAMRKNPEYEKFVLQTIEQNFSIQDPSQSNTFSVLHFGATKDDFKSTSYRSATESEKKRENDLRDEKKKARKKQQEEELRIYYEKKRLLNKFYDKQALEKAIDKRMKFRAEALGDEYSMPVRTSAPPAYIPFYHSRTSKSFFKA